MIKLRKGQLSPAAVERLRERTERLLAHRATGQPVPKALQNGYRDAEVKAAIRAETHEKCAYCESKVSHVYHGDVEHLTPKSVRPELTFEFANLTYACAVCNNNKRDYHDGDGGVINPYVDEPADEFDAVGPLVLHRPGRVRALVTEKVLHLNRAALVERRQERMEQLCHLADAVANASSDGVRLVLERELCREVADDREYAFVSRAYVERVLNRRCA